MGSEHDRRMTIFSKAGLYLVTSAAMSSGRGTMQIIREALDGGVKLIQLREKDLSRSQLFRFAQEARDLTERAGALLLINDHLDVAMAVGADGVHLGQDDFPVRAARKLAPELIIGASSHTVEEARDAESSGASYVNIGPLFPTSTKQWDHRYLGVKGLREISAELTVPFTVMGGIKGTHIQELVEAGARTIAVVTAVTAADNPEEAAEVLICDIRRSIKHCEGA